MEIVVFLTLGGWLWPVLGNLSFVSWTLLSFFCLHYFHRTFIFPFRLQVRGKKMPLSVILMGVAFNIINGSLFGIYFKQYADYSWDWLRDPRFLSGTLIFFIGMLINWRADYYLISLRKSNSSEYKIPRGWLFEYVSCPNLLGEIIEWVGYALLTWSLPGLVFSIWTAANLIPRALAHHRWYLKTFPDYPPQRWAIIPFLW
ncbi:MAG: 3-oxo-5-alpha-steroid 4-dehydrogenase [Flavobacteriales bacterium]|nr:3-oxo-5-alpha-steroid 4-dehydrogenase [Flavobacteriales bacterium]MCX7767619.1 3-oxo-5-alpha-steroid 4-dehydrogenase [Flavobacteriales bacterium]MDW8409539.1 3-oxo-5-alpha-steroid 4-dehydrogenase [Flavobacteriales bacterium]